MSDQPSWSRLDLADLESAYWERIAPAREREGDDSTTDRPDYRWLADNGFSGLAPALREHHDLTVKQFFVGVVCLEDVEAGDDG